MRGTGFPSQKHEVFTGNVLLEGVTRTFFPLDRFEPLLFCHLASCLIHVSSLFNHCREDLGGRIYGPNPELPGEGWLGDWAGQSGLRGWSEILIELLALR